MSPFAFFRAPSSRAMCSQTVGSHTLAFNGALPGAPVWWAGVLLLAMFVVPARGAKAQSVDSDKRQVSFLQGGLDARLTTIRKQLQDGRADLATRNIQSVTQVLEQVAGLTRRIRAKEPDYVPNPPIDFAATPATARAAEYAEAKRMAIVAGSRLNGEAQKANAALLAVKNRQFKTIAVSALKMTVENAPGRQGGKVMDIGLECLKQLNNFLLSKYVAEPIARTSEVELLRGNFVSIRDGEKLLKQIEVARRGLIALARDMDGRQRALNAAVAAEREWKKYAWLKAKGAGELKVRVLSVTAREMRVWLGDTELKADAKGKVLTVGQQIIVRARVVGAKRRFCLEKRAYAEKTRSIAMLPGPGGGPEDSLVYRSTTMPAQTSWTIARETFRWSPSHNGTMTPEAAALSRTYWKQERPQMRWSLKARPGEQVNFKVDGEIEWKLDQNLRGNRKQQTEKNDGSATVVLQLL